MLSRKAHSLCCNTFDSSLCADDLHQRVDGSTLHRTGSREEKMAEMF